MKCILTVKNLVAFAFCTVLLVSAGAGVALSDAAPRAVAPITIQAVQMKGEGVGAELVIATSQPSTYTSYKTAAPHRLVVDFSQAIPADSLTGVNFEKGPVKNVTLKRFDTDAGVLTRMEIYLAQDIEPVITPSMEKNGELRVTFPGYVPAAEAEPVKQETTPPVPTPAETPAVQPAVDTIKDAPAAGTSQNSAEPQFPVVTDVVARDGGVTIVIQNAVGEYKTFRLNKPERVVVDIPNAKLAMSNKLVSLNVTGVSTARVGSYADKVRVVFDALNGSLADARIEKTANGLNVQFAAAVGETAPAAEPARNEAPVVASPVVQQPKPNTVKEPVHKGNAQVAALDFQVLEGLSRVTVKLTGTAVVDQPQKAAGSVSMRIKNVQLPLQLQRSLEAREFASPVLRVTPVQVKTKVGSDIMIRVALKTDASFEMKREADLVYLDIKHPAAMTKPAEQPTAAAAQKAAAGSAGLSADQIEKVAEPELGTGKNRYTGRKVTLEFADAEVRKIFQLLSEVSNKNFVLGDEVTGTISLKLVNVPWDQALDIILDTKGLDKREQGNIVLIRGKGKFKSLLDEEMEVRKATLKSEPLETKIFEVNYADIGGIVTQFNALKTERGVITSDARTNKVIVKDVKTTLADMAKLLKDLDVPEKQVMIEARIVEASADFSRSLGVSWGLKTDPSGGGDRWPFVNSLSTVFGGIASTPGTSTIGSTTGAADITFGTIGANVKLSMRLNAAAKAGLVRIISSPKVATLNNKSAKITQGKQIPYISSTSDKVETKFVEAALSLEVTPHINNNGTIILKVDAKNDAPDTTSSSATPPINKKQATTEMLLKDGETTVIGGIFVDSEAEGSEGIPWLMDIPLLGNIFKSKTYSKNKSELLIFITPRILNSTI